jgi:hypothetical protein
MKGYAMPSTIAGGEGSHTLLALDSLEQAVSNLQDAIGSIEQKTIPFRLPEGPELAREDKPAPRDQASPVRERIGLATERLTNLTSALLRFAARME